MLIESAFSMLPEAVAGYGFQKVKREANAVGCFSFSLLNALHSKNILDPIQRIQLEKHYGSRVVPLPQNGNDRHCDLFLDYGGSKIGSDLLSNYGWRYLNYVEVKYLKSYRQTNSGQDTRASINSAEIIADLIRLVILTPEPQIVSKGKNPKTASARYFLCLSDLSPEKFINQYLKDLHAAFKSPAKSVSISVDLTTGKQTSTLAGKIGTGFNAIHLEIPHATCFAHYPLSAAKTNSVWMLLIRIDAAKITCMLNGRNLSFELGTDRSITEGAVGDYTAIRDFVAVNIK